MPNPKGNEASLTKFKPKWKSGKTRTIRVPIAIADLILEAAQEIDTNGNKSLLQVIYSKNELIEELKKSLSTVTSEKNELLTESVSKPENLTFNTDTSESIREGLKDLELAVRTKKQGGSYIGNNAKPLKEKVLNFLSRMNSLGFNSDTSD